MRFALRLHGLVAVGLNEGGVKARYALLPVHRVEPDVVGGARNHVLSDLVGLEGEDHVFLSVAVHVLYFMLHGLRERAHNARGADRGAADARMRAREVDLRGDKLRIRIKNNVDRLLGLRVDCVGEHRNLVRHELPRLFSDRILGLVEGFGIEGMEIGAGLFFREPEKRCGLSLRFGGILHPGLFEAVHELRVVLKRIAVVVDDVGELDEAEGLPVRGKAEELRRALEVLGRGLVTAHEGNRLRGSCEREEGNIRRFTGARHRAVARDEKRVLVEHKDVGLMRGRAAEADPLMVVPARVVADLRFMHTQKNDL